MLPVLTQNRLRIWRFFLLNNVLVNKICTEKGKHCNFFLQKSQYSGTWKTIQFQLGHLVAQTLWFPSQFQLPVTFKGKPYFLKKFSPGPLWFVQPLIPRVAILRAALSSWSSNACFASRLQSHLLGTGFCLALISSSLRSQYWLNISHQVCLLHSVPT